MVESLFEMQDEHLFMKNNFGQMTWPYVANSLVYDNDCFGSYLSNNCITFGLDVN